MFTGILHHGAGLPDYYAEILRTWGLRGFHAVQLQELNALSPATTPTLICPSGPIDERALHALEAYMTVGGVVIATCPEPALAKLAGLQAGPVITQPLMLRLSGITGTGLAAEPVPIVGKTRLYTIPDNSCQTLAHIWAHGQPFDLGAGIIKAPVGAGSLVVIAFDLALSVLLCRQGDPSKVGRIPSHAPAGNEGCRAVNMVVDVGPAEPTTIPYADAVGRTLVEIVSSNLPGPHALLWHLPGEATGLVVYSGDEDLSPLETIDGQMESLARVGARMNLYVIPEMTNSKTEDYKRYLKRHDLGPHPNLRNHDNVTMQEKLDEFTRQVLLFESITGVKTRSLRNHHVVWIGYTEQADRMAEMGIRMDGNYNYGSYMRSRDPGAYSGWGAGMPMRFCTTDGRLIDVIQQHTHVGDDHNFSTLPQTDYSYRITPEVYDAQLHLTFQDMEHRFHVPYAVNIHPINWARFSGGHSDAILNQTVQRGIPVYSVDQWSTFWDQRDTWKVSSQTWSQGTLKWQWDGQPAPAEMSGLLPAMFNDATLNRLTINGEVQPVRVIKRHLRSAVPFIIPTGVTQIIGEAYYT